MEERILTLHPDPNKSGTRIHRWKYEVVREAILEALPATKPGLLFKELSPSVRKTLGPESVEKLGSVTWYAVTVKLDLEARGEISRVPDARPQRLIRTS
jgi:hypothetical protein